MNKQILDLAKQSGLIQYDSDGKLEEVRKFALLIVAECLKQADIVRDECDGDGQKVMALGAEWAALRIARYFGVQ